MRYIGIGDIHFKPSYYFRLDSIKSTFENKFEQVFKLAKDIEAGAILCTGDWFEDKSPYNCPPGFLYWIIDLLKSSPVPIFSIVGNHDIRNNDLRTIPSQPLGVLFKSGTVRQLDANISEDPKIGRLPGVAGFDYGYNITDFITPGEWENKIGVFHCYMAPADGTMFGNEDVYSFDRFAEAGFSHVLNGHDHNHYDLMQVKETYIHRPGALFRMKRDEVDMNRRVAVTSFGGGLLPSYFMLDIKPAVKVFDMKAKIVKEENNENIEVFVKSLSSINLSPVGSIDEELKALKLEKPVLAVITDSLDKAKGGIE